MNHTNPNQDSDLRSFHTMIARLKDGSLNEELTELVKKCVMEIADACLDRGGKHSSELTLKLKFTMDHKDKIVEIFPEISEKYPKAPMGRAGMFFCNAKGELTRNSPHQLSLEDELHKKRMQDAMNTAGVVNSGA